MRDAEREALLNAELAQVRHSDQPEGSLDVGIALFACGNISAALKNFTAAGDLRQAGLTQGMPWSCAGGPGSRRRGEACAVSSPCG